VAQRWAVIIMDPLTAFRLKYFKLPDCKKSLGIMLGLMILDKFYLDNYVEHHIFGRDGKGGPILLMKGRIDHHEQEYREARKKWYWHQRIAKFYIPVDHNFNDKIDLKELTYNNSHFNTFLDPKDLPRHHDPEGFYFNVLTPEDFYKQ
jgi:hypothetical protein